MLRLNCSVVVRGGKKGHMTRSTKTAHDQLIEYLTYLDEATRHSIDPTLPPEPQTGP